MNEEKKLKDSRVKLWIGVIAAIVIIVLAAAMLRSSADESAAKIRSNSDKPSAKNSVIKDPAVLAKIWDEYIQDSIATIANGAFETPEKINREYAIQYAVRVIIRHKAYQEIEPGWARISPRLVSEYIKKYMSISVTDIKPSTDYDYTAFYDSSKDVFDIGSMNSSSSYVKYNEMTPWTIQLDSVVKNEIEGTYHVKMVQFITGRDSRIKKEIICVLKERPDGSLYFQQIVHKYPDKGHLISIKGKYQKLDSKKLRTNSANKEWPFQVLADFDGQVFIRSDNGKEGGKYEDNISVYNARDFQELMTMNSPGQFLRMKQIQNGYMLICSDSIIRLDQDLKNPEKVMLPDSIREAYGADWWGGFDMTKDARYFVYSSQDKGLVLYDTETESEKVLAAHLPKNTKMDYTPCIYNPIFVDNDHKVAAKISGYEGLEGYFMADLDTLQAKKLTMNDFYTDFHTFDSALPAAFGICSQTENPDGTGKPAVFVVRMDYSRMDFSRTRVLTHEKAQRYLLPEEEGSSPVIYNDSYLVYISEQYAQTHDPADNVYHIVRVNLDTMQAETLLSIKAGFPQILGMLDNGRVIFSYHFESETGMGITGP